jgi:hypothetical protein
MAVADKTTVDFQLLFGKKLKPLYSKNVLNTTYDVYMIERHHQTKMFIQNIKDYPYNYDIQEEHVSLIAEQLKTSHHLMSPFIVIQMTEPKNATDDVFMLIDGHHRILALKKILEEDLAFKIELEVRVYKSDFMESALTQQLFRLCNIVKKINKNDKIQDILNTIGLNLKHKYGDIIKPENKRTAQRPNFSVITLREGCIQLLAIKPDITADTRIMGVEIFNDTLKSKPVQDIYKSYGEKEIIYYAKAKKYEFYLGLRHEFVNEMWKSQFTLDVV